MFVNGLKNMVSVPAWPLVADGVFYLPVALKAEPKSLLNKKQLLCYLNPTGYGSDQILIKSQKPAPESQVRIYFSMQI